jgi:hypothetical protein
MDPSTGLTTFGVVNVTTRYGTNGTHGEGLVSFLTSGSLARSAQTVRAVSTSTIRRPTGPIVRHKIPTRVIQ